MEVGNLKKTFNLKKTSEFSLNVRKKILEMSFNAGSASAHIGGALSSSDIISVIFSDFLKYDKNKTTWEERDRFILETCKDNCIPVQVSMGGGYSMVLKNIIEAHSNTFRLAQEIFF